jgi:hypothetical protein
MTKNQKTIAIISGAALAFGIAYVYLSSYAKAQENAAKSNLFGALAGLGSSVFGLFKSDPAKDKDAAD